jgi:hypothetical protein
LHLEQVVQLEVQLQQAAVSSYNTSCVSPNPNVTEVG